MAYENIRVAHSNFCLGPQVGTYCSVDTSGVSAVMRVKNGSGDLIKTYDFYPSSELHVDSQSSVFPYRKVESLKYTGPLGQSGFYTGMPFYTLERQIESNGTSSSCVIKQWELNFAQSRLEIKRIIAKTSNSEDHYDCSAMVIEVVRTKFSASTPVNTGVISIEGASDLKKYDLLMLGPSSDITNLNAIEYCYVHSISGTNVKIRTVDPAWPTKYEYLENDPITAIKYAYLFSSEDVNNKAALYKLGLDNYNVGANIHKEENGLFNNVSAADWDAYFSGVAFVKERNLLTISTSDYEVFKSRTLKNLEINKKDSYPIYDIAFDNSTLYRLQNKITTWDNSGSMGVAIWTSYNYVADPIAPYSASVVIYAYPAGYVFRQQSIYLKIKVKDQYGVALQFKNVQFYQQNDVGAYLTPANGQEVSDINGEAVVQYTAGANYTGIIKFSVRVDGASSHLGSQYIWDIFYGQSLASFSVFQKVITQVLPVTSGALTVNQIKYPLFKPIDRFNFVDPNIVLSCYSKFTFPGGHWGSSRSPSSDNLTFLIEQAMLPLQNPLDETGRVAKSSFRAIHYLHEGNEAELKQKSRHQNTLPIDQMYISRHYLSGNSDNVIINQFVFVQEARPVFWSEKNPVNTDIWLRLRPYASSLDPNTFKIKIRESSYAGEEGWRDITEEGTVTLYDAGGGMFGVEFQWYPTNYFHNNGIVYAFFEIYDTALIPNKIITEYWFILIPDYKMPYVENIFPEREAFNIKIDTNIIFDIKDVNTGVDISSLEVYVNYRQVYPTYISIEGGYHIEYNPTSDFNYNDTVLVSIKVNDISEQHNRLIDSWRFYCIESSAPWVDSDEMRPGRCMMGMPRKSGEISMQIYTNNDGIDEGSIELFIGGPKREATIKPIVYRLN
jgi:hypothetical protein